MPPHSIRRPIHTATLAAAALLLCAPLSGCLAVGYTSGGGWFVWPGAGVLLVIALLFFLLRGRR